MSGALEAQRRVLLAVLEQLGDQRVRRHVAHAALLQVHHAHRVRLRLTPRSHVHATHHRHVIGGQLRRPRLAQAQQARAVHRRALRGARRQRLSAAQSRQRGVGGRLAREGRVDHGHGLALRQQVELLQLGAEGRVAHGALDAGPVGEGEGGREPDELAVGADGDVPAHGEAVGGHGDHLDVVGGVLVGLRVSRCREGYDGAGRTCLEGQKVGHVEMGRGGLDALREQVVDAEVAVGAHQQVALRQRDHAVADQILEMTSDERMEWRLHVVAHLDGGLRHVVDQHEALVVDRDDVLSGDGCVAGVARPHQRVVVEELHAAQTRHGGGRRIGGSRGNGVNRRVRIDFGNVTVVLLLLRVLCRSAKQQLRHEQWNRNAHTLAEALKTMLFDS